MATAAGQPHLALLVPSVSSKPCILYPSDWRPELQRKIVIMSGCEGQAQCLEQTETGGKPMNVTQRERKAGASGAAFTTSVVPPILLCIGLVIWRPAAGDKPNGPPALAQTR